MAPVKIVADSTCDLSAELIERYDVDIVPLYVNLGGEMYKDTPALGAGRIFDYVAKTGVLPGTVAASVADFTECFKKWRDAGREVVCITISSEMSCSMQNARIAAEDVGGVTVVDSRNLSTGVGHVVVNASILAGEGKSREEIAAALSEIIPKVRASFILDRLDYMKKGGRCSSVMALGANLLHIKPTILVENGKMRVGQKFRGPLKTVLLEYVDAQLSGREIRPERIFITHPGNMDEEVAAVRARIERHMHFDEILETCAGGTITSHCGQNTLGILFIEK